MILDEITDKSIMEKENAMDIFNVLSMIGGLSLFLYGMSNMGNGLSKMAGGKLETILEKLTSKKIFTVIGKFFTFCLEKGHKGGEKLKEKAGKGLFVALLLFVGIPVPGTGAWTGTLAASILDMDFKQSVVAVMLGVVLAGIIMGVVSAGLFGAIFAL